MSNQKTQMKLKKTNEQMGQLRAQLLKKIEGLGTGDIGEQGAESDGGVAPLEDLQSPSPLLSPKRHLSMHGQRTVGPEEIKSIFEEMFTESLRQDEFRQAVKGLIPDNFQIQKITAGSVADDQLTTQSNVNQTISNPPG